MSSSAHSSKHSDSCDRKKAVSDSINELSQSGYEYLGKIGSGSFGDVIKLRDSASGLLKAAKVIIPTNIEEKELLIWSTMKHKNIIEAEGAKILSNGTIIILMPLLQSSLFDIINEKWFVKHRNGIQFVKRWFYDCLQAVHYMHKRSICHLDLTLNNVLISLNGSAIVCDFSFATNSEKKLSRNEIGVPGIYKPPELSIGNREYFDGGAIDMWCFGLMVEEALTGFALTDRVKKCYSWRRDIRPMLKLIVYPCVFNSLVRDCYCNCQIQTDDLDAAIDFIDSCLRVKPDSRISTDMALEHCFMQNVGVNVDLLKDISNIDMTDVDPCISEANDDDIQYASGDTTSAQTLNRSHRIHDARNLSSIKVYKQDALLQFQKTKQIKKNAILAKKVRRQLNSHDASPFVRIPTPIPRNIANYGSNDLSPSPEGFPPSIRHYVDSTDVMIDSEDDVHHAQFIFDSQSLSSFHPSNCVLQSWICQKWNNFVLWFLSIKGKSFR